MGQTAPGQPDTEEWKLADRDIAAEATLPRPVFWLLAMWVLLVLVTLAWGVDNAETRLRADARQALTADGHDVVVDFSGRDARLVGSVGSEEIAAQIVGSIDAIPGVRDVVNEISVVEPPPVVVPDAEIAVRIIGNAVSVRGSVGNPDIESDLVDAAEEAFGVGRVVNALTVSEDIEMPAWMGRVRDVFPLARELRSGGFTATATGFFIEGEVLSEAVRTEILQEITLIFDGATAVRSDLTIAVLPDPSFLATGAGSLVTLDGILPNQEAIDRIAEAAYRLHSGTIVNGLDIGEVAGPTWLESIDGLLDVVTRLDPWTLTIDMGIVSITGLAPDADLAATVGLLAQEVAAGQLEVVADVQVDPTAIATRLTNLLQGSTTFESNGIELSAEGSSLLDSAIDILLANPSAALVVEGYTDDQGDDASNLILSQQRADAVVAYLVAGGIDADRLSAVGYGEANPIADNSTAEGRAQNRRIEFVIEEGDE